MSTLRDLIAGPQPVPVPLVFNPMTAKLAEAAGFKALYLGGGSMGYLKCVTEANLNLTEMCQAGLDIRSVCSLPLILDGACGWGDPMHMHRTIGMSEAAGFSAIEIEDQILPKRTHHHIGIEHIVSAELMVAKIKEALAARRSRDFLIIARTNAARMHGLDEALSRAEAYKQAGADMLLVLAKTPDQVATIGQRVDHPMVLLASGDIGNTAIGMILIRVVVGCGTGPIMASAVALAAQWFPMSERGLVTGIQGFSVSLGIALGFVIVPLIFQSTGSWQAALAWLVVSVLVSLALVLVLALGPKPPIGHFAATGAPTSGSSGGEFKLALMHIATWAGVICAFLNSWEFQAFNDLTPAYLAVAPPVGVGLGPMGSGKFMLAVQLAYMAGSLLSGAIAEKVFSGRAKPMVMVGSLVSAASCFSLKFSVIYSDETMLLLSLILFGFFAAFVNPQINAFIAKNYPEHITGKLAGLAMSLCGFGATLGVSAGAFALHTTGLYQLSLSLVSIAAIIAFIWAFVLNPPKGLRN